MPITISVDSPMTPDNFVESLMILAEGNPDPEVASFSFSALSGEAVVSTRVRLQQSSTLTAAAKLNNGKSYRTSINVEVATGGCGA